MPLDGIVCTKLSSSFRVFITVQTVLCNCFTCVFMGIVILSMELSTVSTVKQVGGHVRCKLDKIWGDGNPQNEENKLLLSTIIE